MNDEQLIQQLARLVTEMRLIDLIQEGYSIDEARALRDQCQQIAERSNDTARSFSLFKIAPGEFPDVNLLIMRSVLSELGKKIFLNSNARFHDPTQMEFPDGWLQWEYDYDESGNLKQIKATFKIRFTSG